MPNHFLTIGLCSRGYAEDGDEIQVDYQKIADQNLCAVSDPLPDELMYIVSELELARYQNKETGEWLKDVNGPMHEPEKFNRVPLTPEYRNELRQKYGADNWYDWQHQNWGTKWGTYDTIIRELGGDSAPVLIEFCSAWVPPNKNMMQKITDYLCKEYHFEEIVWLGHDPFDNRAVTDIL